MDKIQKHMAVKVHLWETLRGCNAIYIMPLAYASTATAAVAAVFKLKNKRGRGMGRHWNVQILCKCTMCNTVCKICFKFIIFNCFECAYPSSYGMNVVLDRNVFMYRYIKFGALNS